MIVHYLPGVIFFSYFLSRVPLVRFCKTAEFTHTFLLLHIQWEVLFFNDVSFCVIFCVIKSLFLSVLVIYTHVKVDKAVVSSLWPHVVHKICVCNSRTFPNTCNLFPTLSLNDKFFSDLLNCAHIVKFGEVYLTCNGLHANCMGTSHVGHFPAGGVRKCGAVRSSVLLSLLVSHIF